MCSLWILFSYLILESSMVICENQKQSGEILRFEIIVENLMHIEYLWKVCSISLRLKELRLCFDKCSNNLYLINYLLGEWSIWMYVERERLIIFENAIYYWFIDELIHIFKTLGALQTKTFRRNARIYEIFTITFYSCFWLETKFIRMIEIRNAMNN